MVTWATTLKSPDNFFPLENAQRYGRELKQGRVQIIPDAYSFTPEDQPRLLAEAIARFVGTV